MSPRRSESVRRIAAIEAVVCRDVGRKTQQLIDATAGGLGAAAESLADEFDFLGDRDSKNEYVLDLGAKTGVAEPCAPHGKKGIVFVLKSRALVRMLRQRKAGRNVKSEAELLNAERLPRLRLEKRAAK
jgi:hypothetical protein